jgi:hypothetical protein
MIRVKEELRAELEHRLQFPKAGGQEVHVAVAGNAAAANQLRGWTDAGTTYDVSMVVGPYWNDIDAVVPKVTIDGVYQEDADEDDRQAFTVAGLSWDSIGEQGPHRDLLRIRLNFGVHVAGERSYLGWIGYTLFARGLRRDELSIDDPGPVAPQG